MTDALEPPRAAVTVVADAGPLIHLDELNSVALLADFNAVLVPGAVWDEVLRHRPQALSSAALPLHRCTL